jgi:hypothetical protein
VPVYFNREVVHVCREVSQGYTPFPTINILTNIMNRLKTKEMKLQAFPDVRSCCVAADPAEVEFA